jgi:hypothetical protein
LRAAFIEARGTIALGAAGVLRRLSDLASACVIGTTDAQDAVAFVLSQILLQHSEDREDREITANDTYHLLAAGEEHLSEAVEFIEKGGGSDDAVRIIAALARLTPDHFRMR